ncbi:hypothetical protein FrEUN1fDRAFT_4671 [Parafrankia sp. EUN1f]|nr:hypothetical protein FrEUN1fDRAFT_4671 [Parafrankia sp. EUN1f]
MLAAALEAEVDTHIAELADQRDDRGRRLLVRNGHPQLRQVMTAGGAVQVTAPRVNDRRVDADTGERQRFSSAILPQWCRSSPTIGEVLPLPYLHGLSFGDFVPALEQFLGSGAGLSSSTVTRLTTSWQADYQAFTDRDLAGVDHVHLWADGIRINIHLAEEELCLLVLIDEKKDLKQNQAVATRYNKRAYVSSTAVRVTPNQRARKSRCAGRRGTGFGHCLTPLR